VQLKLIDVILKSVISKSRLRGINSYIRNDKNLEKKISQNFDKVLQTPLNFIEKELESATEQ